MSRTLPAIAIAALLLFTGGHAVASGGEDPVDSFVNRNRTDIALGRYQGGHLGVVLPSYVRSNLFTAWRAVMLGAPGLQTAPNPPGALALVEERRGGGWQDQSQGREIYAAWRTAVHGALKREMDPAPAADPLIDSYLNCPTASYVFATRTLGELTARADATPARLATWVSTQREVFKACGDDPLDRRDYFQRPRVLVQPAPLAATEPLYWRQVQEYQLASAAFYSEDYARSTALFDRIGATEGHPLRAWGDYLALRSQGRAALYVPGTPDERWQARVAQAKESPDAKAARQARQQQALADVEARIARIVANPALAARHGDSRGIGRILQAKFTPVERFAQVSQLLDDARNDPYRDDRLGDWLALADRLLDQPATGQPELRAVSGLVDWVFTVQQCSPYSPEDNREFAAKVGAACAPSRAHVQGRWQHYAKDGNAAQARAWLFAAAMINDRLTPELEKAMLQVAPSAPEYLTVRYALARHYRLNDKADQARALSEAELNGAALSSTASDSARNLFLQERFAVATSVSDAARYLLRSRGYQIDADTGEPAAVQDPDTVARGRLAADGKRWLNTGLAASDLLTLAADRQLPADERGRIALTALMRFDMTGQYEAAVRAAQQVEVDAPELAPLMRQYRALTANPERHHWLMLNAVKYGFSPMRNTWAMAVPYVPREVDETRADMWCKMPSTAGQEYQENGWVMQTVWLEQAPPMPQVAGVDGARRKAELAQLGALKTATGYLGDHVLQRVASKPNDADLPWLLHVVVRSTRGGCLDDDAQALSKQAFTVLHKRYSNSAWAKKTPYFY